MSVEISADVGVIPRDGKGRHRVALGAVFAAAAVLLAGPVQALDFPTDSGTVMLMGSGSGYYNGGEWPELARSMLTILVILVADEEDDGRDLRDYSEEEELGVSVPKAQLGAGISYFLSSNLAVGARYIYRRDFRENEIGRLWGGGPELVYFFGDYRSPIRPFVSAGFLLTGAVRRQTGQRLADGGSVNIRGGLNFAVSNSVGLVLQTGYQSDRISSPGGEPLIGKTVGLGVGLTAAIF